MLEALFAAKSNGLVGGVDAVLPNIYRYSAAAAYLGQTPVSFGGRVDGVLDNQVRMYNRDTKQMTVHPTSGATPSVKEMSMGCMLGDDFYVLGGNPKYTEFHRLSWSTGNWVVLAAPPRNVYAGSLVHHNGYLYFSASNSANAVTLLRYQIASNTWVNLAVMSFKVLHGRMVEYGDKLYCIGGYDYAASVRNGKCYVYDIQSASWSQIATMPVPVSEHDAVVIGSEIYVLGGIGNGPRSNAVQIYDILTDTWRNGGKFGVPTNGAQAVLIDGAIYRWGGIELLDTGAGRNMYKYTP